MPKASWNQTHLALAALFLAASVCESGLTQEPSKTNLNTVDKVDFVRDIRPIFERHCIECHGTKHQRSGFRLDFKKGAMRGGERGAAIIPGDIPKSPILEWVTAQDDSERMPPGPEHERLSDATIDLLREWIAEGASWPEGIDSVQETDPKSHWSFRPLQTFESGETIDSLVDRKLEASGLSRSPEATAMQWLRRVSIDLHGLPPSQELVAWLAAQNLDGNRSPGDQQVETAYRHVVDELLASPRYAERWAQHWLDVVRYADTHGFEVNTERPHAWHYRDYVIDALHKDTPYKEFIRQQIAGDQLGQDTAPGFLITASVLLPGQIGADEPSKRLARQDAIDEILVNIGQTFLGLSIGCARCHDHKFDPISQKDYYAMQAFVAGVEYEDRIVATPRTIDLRSRIEALSKERIELEQKLDRWEQPARLVTQSIELPNSAKNEVTIAPTLAQFVRMEILGANQHPTLGIIEPCIDEFEIWTNQNPPQNVALASRGTVVKASGSRESDTHQLKFIHDGEYGNASSWMSDQMGQGWIEFQLPEPMEIAKITWGRDRNGQFQDRTATAYRIEVGENSSALKEVAGVSLPRPMVNAKRNSDRFPPTMATAARMRILETNRLEPCIDELEVFSTEGVNVALSENGATATSTGDSVAIDRHELRFINDGQYGNERSWMSNQTGQGEVTIQWSKPTRIDRIVWGRDRQGKYSDRLATKYVLEVRTEDGTWVPLATQADRVPWTADGSNAATQQSTASQNIMGFLSSVGISGGTLSAEDLASIRQIEKRLQSIQREIQDATEAQKAFAGKFRTPDEIRVLHRGDPEQPKDLVTPAIPRFFAEYGSEANHFADLQLELTSDDATRRLSLANWIADPRNPLTSRVIVNRIWQGHFGIGLVETSNDFGLNGTPPSNPELLDWLAQHFLQTGGSLKELHRTIVLSETYRQSADAPKEYATVGRAVDAQSRLLWRYPRKRMEAEAIRDTMLSVSGELNLQMFGRGYDLFAQRGGLSGFQPVESFPPEGLRRMIYAHKVRREREAVFGAFDCPDAGQSTGLRRSSTTPIQALNLFNSPFTIERSVAFAKRIQSIAPQDTAAQIQTAYELCLQRKPDVSEISEASEVVEQYGLEVLCRSLFNSNEFLFTP